MRLRTFWAPEPSDCYRVLTFVGFVTPPNIGCIEVACNNYGSKLKLKFDFLTLGPENSDMVKNHANISPRQGHWNWTI